MPLSQTCSIGSGINTKTITIEEALERRTRHGKFIGACAECGDRVRAHKASRIAAAHFEHMEGNLSCSLSAPHRP